MTRFAVLASLALGIALGVVAALSLVYRRSGAEPETERGTCWFCKGEFVVDALIAGYDTFEEQRLACLACNERISGNWTYTSAGYDGEAIGV